MCFFLVARSGLRSAFPPVDFPAFWLVWAMTVRIMFRRDYLCKFSVLISAIY